MQKDEVKNFLRLSTALKLLLAPSISDASIDRASKLYEDYVLELDQVSSFSSLSKIGTDY